MAKLTKLPALAIINGFKGVIDYYVHDGVACARRWPRSPGHLRAQAVMAQWSDFAYASRSWQTLSPEVQAAYIETAHGTSLSGRDLYVKSYLTDYFRDGQWGTDY